MCWLFYYYCSVLADYLRLITGNLQEVGLQGPDKEAPTSHRILRINNEPPRPTQGVRFCLSRRSAPFHRESLFESNSSQSQCKSRGSRMTSFGHSKPCQKIMYI